MKNQILKSASILAFSGICAKSFDFIFRAFYSRRLGAEGMGLMSLGFGLHGVMLTVATAGLGVAVSKIVSEYLEKKNLGAAGKSMKLAIYGVSVLSLSIIFLTFLFSGQISKHILSDPRISAGICCLVPSILFMGVSYCLKGYFYAARKVIYPALSEFLEQAVKFLSISLLLKIFLPYGIEYGCAAVFLGISIGELSSCLFLSLFFLKDAKLLLTSKTHQTGIPSSILKISVPSMASSFTGSALRMQEEVWIVTAFKQFGMTHAEALGNLGLIHGMAMPMLVFPLTLMGSVTTLLIPEIARSNATPNKKRLHHLTKKVWGFGLLAGIIVAVVFYVFPHKLSYTIYHRPEIAPVLKTLAFLSPLMFLDSLSCAILNGLGKQFSLMFYSMTDSAFRLLSIIIFIPHFGINALYMIIILSNIYTCTLTVLKVVKSSNLCFRK